MSRITVCILAAALLTGCSGGKKGPKTVSVSGKVTFGGSPLVGAKVTFVGENFTSVGTTDDKGQYQLQQGAVSGKNRVYISKIEGSNLKGYDPDPAAGMDAGQFEAQNPGAVPGKVVKKPGELLPLKYSNPESSELTYEVPEGGTDSANFFLKK